MAQKKFIYDINGKVKESTGNYYDDSANEVVIKNLSFNSMSLDMPDSPGFINGSQLSSSTGQNNKSLVWDSVNSVWKLGGGEVDLSSTSTAVIASSDIEGTFDDVKIATLSNVNSGTLSVANGGTGLNSSQYPVGESLLLGNGAAALQFLTGSSDSVVVSSTSTGWTYITQSNTRKTEVEVSFFTQSGNWTRPSNTRSIRVLAQGGGGGGGSGANRDSAAAALGGAGGGAGAFIDTGIINIDNILTTASVIVGVGGSGAIYPVTNSSGIDGGSGGSSSFGDPNDGIFISSNGGNGGQGGLINSSTISTGGTSVTASSNTYDNFIYNINIAVNNSDAGASNSTTAGVNSTFTSSSTSYYDAGGGGSGGSLASLNYTTNYNGGNGGASITNRGTTSSLNASGAITSSVSSIIGISDPVYLASGGGGAASAAVTQSLGENLFLVHFNSSDANAIKDYSIYNSPTFSGSFTSVVSTSSLGITPISGTFSDGVLSCSAGTQGAAGTYLGFYGSNIPSITGDFTTEGWFYLANTGSAVADGNVSCYLMGLGYSELNFATGILVSINKAGFLKYWINGAFPTGNATTTINIGANLNKWNHIVTTRSGSTITPYFNGTAYPTFTAAPTITNTYPSIGLGASRYANYNPNGYVKEFSVINRAKTSAEIVSYYNNVIAGLSGSFANPDPLQSYPGGLGGNGAWGSGGGGGGGSTNAVSNLTSEEVEKISLIHFDLSDVNFKDKTLYNNTVTSSLVRLVSTGSVGIPAINSLMPDGVLSSSYAPQQTSGISNLYITTNSGITDNYTIESWFYLKNTGSSGEINNGGATCYLLGDGYISPTNGILLGINKGTSALMAWSDASWRGTGSVGLTPTMNEWNHIALQKSGTTITMYLNGNPSVITNCPSTTNTGTFGYALAASAYSQWNFNGYAKEFLLTNRIKSASEIQNYYNAVQNNTLGSYADPSGAIKQGGDGGDGYVAVISYKY